MKVTEGRAGRRLIEALGWHLFLDGVRKRPETSLIFILVDFQTGYLPNRVIMLQLEQTCYVTFNHTQCLRRTLFLTRLIFILISCLWREKVDVFNRYAVHSTFERVDMFWQTFLCKCAIVSIPNDVIFNLLHCKNITGAYVLR